MTPDQQRWLGRARELAAQVQRRLVALEYDHVVVVDLLNHTTILLEAPEWHGEVLDAFLKDMLPLADCCASLDARLSDDGQRSTRCVSDSILLAGMVSTVSRQILIALALRFRSGASIPPPALIKRLASSVSVVVRWWPKALRAAAVRELGQATQLSGTPAPRVNPPSGPELLFLATEAAGAASDLLDLVEAGGRHVGELRATLCAPAALAATIGNLAAVYAQFARSSATFTAQVKEWLAFTVLVANLLHVPDNAAAALPPLLLTAVEEDEDVQQQLAAALLPYAAHLLEVRDLKSVSWLKAWGCLVPVLTKQAVWPNPEAGAVSGAMECGAAVQEGLLHLLRAVPPLRKPPKPDSVLPQQVSIPLYSAQAAAVAATKAFEVAERLPQAEVRQKLQQHSLSMLLALLPLTVDLLTAAAGKLDGDTHASLLGSRLYAYAGTLEKLLNLTGPAARFWDEELGQQMPPEHLAVGAEAALRLAAQAAEVAQPWALGQGVSQHEEHVHTCSMAAGEYISLCLLTATRQEVSAAPEPGGVRPSLQAQLNLVHTICKFAHAQLAPGGAVSSMEEAAADKLRGFVRLLLDRGSMLVIYNMYDGDIPAGRAPLTPEEERALVGAALALGAAGSAVVHLLPEGPTYRIQLIANALELSNWLQLPELAGALLAQHAGLAEQLVAGLLAALKDNPSHEADRVLADCDSGLRRAVQANRRLGPMMLGGAAGEALEAAVRQSGQDMMENRGCLGYLSVAQFLMSLTRTAEGCLDDYGRTAAARLRRELLSKGGEEELWQVVRAAADEWLAQEAQQQWRQEQLLLCTEAAATRACTNLACTNLGGASEAGLKARKCSGCRCVRYCSTACQRADWGAGHMAMCKRLRARQAAVS